ncbi:HAD-IA family hydrolase, partial [Pluralibacter sp.]|uniref:HAD-IA family hydrolase n=1 Tax=Pluralibacter sp. TaxID=1920032 RepID=UPI0025CF30D4
PYFFTTECVNEIKVLAMENLRHVKAIPGAIDFIKKIPSDRYAIVTSGAKKISMQSVVNAGLPVPDYMISAEDVTHGKPDPEPYLKAARMLGVNPDECLVFEDAESGIRSAQSAGMQVIVINHSCYSHVDNTLIQLPDYRNMTVTMGNKLIELNW